LKPRPSVPNGCLRCKKPNPLRSLRIKRQLNATVDGRNPAPIDMDNIACLLGLQRNALFPSGALPLFPSKVSQEWVLENPSASG